MTELVIGLVAGLLVGLACAWFVLRGRRSDEEQMRNAFAGLSQQALQANAEQVVRLAHQTLAAQTESARKDLESDKKLIDQNLATVTQRLGELQAFVQRADRDRAGSHQALSAQLQGAAQETLRLRQTAEQLSKVLASPSHRGQWGERMAEDVLRLAGFIEDVNYMKQQRIEGGTKPDYTFPLPNGLRLNMDVKFPFANYKLYLEAATDDERGRYGKAFIADVRNRIREAASRDYINTADGTVEYALVFIPNEQVYSSIHELAPGVVDEALESRIVLCSPLTLYAVLAVIRQAAENVAMERQASEMVDLIVAFAKQWGLFKEELEKLGRQMDTAQKTYAGLSTTRVNQLQKPMDKIEELRSAREPGMLPGPDAEQGRRDA